MCVTTWLCDELTGSPQIIGMISFVPEIYRCSARFVQLHNMQNALDNFEIAPVPFANFGPKWDPNNNPDSQHRFVNAEVRLGLGLVGKQYHSRSTRIYYSDIRGRSPNDCFEQRWCISNANQTKEVFTKAQAVACTIWIRLVHLAKDNCQRKCCGRIYWLQLHVDCSPRWLICCVYFWQSYQSKHSCTTV